ncbi:MAG TPA: zinc dependent phospholipase C family protein [Flavisolibacter sp.]|nr:zinc dependent phospholipase C family protein [Flavisolibacter sp.]
MKKNKLFGCLMIIAFIIAIPLQSFAYSVLTHEALIDANWDKAIVPLLKDKFPGVTQDQLTEAQAYAYGGAVAPDMGYYPFGSKLFTNLVHYVRSGDFVEALLQESQTVYEYAFALGALCHYNADIYGHSLGVNKSVPLIYPEMRKKYGNVVTYAEDNLSHKRTEFAFDVLQTARGSYASTAYHKFIGFQVSKEVLERAFKKTYGLDVNDLFGNFNRAVNTFRWACNSLFPELTKIAWSRRKADIKKVNPTATSRSFEYRMHKATYKRDFGKDYNQPRFFARFFGVLLRIIPKFGPLKAFKFRKPTPEAEKLFISSFDSVGKHFDARLAALHSSTLNLSDMDFDTGNPTTIGEYPLSDKTYEEWLLKLKSSNFETVSPQIKNNIISFYQGHDAILAANTDTGDFQKTKDALQQLKNTNISLH